VEIFPYLSFKTMAKLRVYDFLTLNGFYKGANEDISWAKGGSKEESDFAADIALFKYEPK
jgi:hypothetical protein